MKKSLIFILVLVIVIVIVVGYFGFFSITTPKIVTKNIVLEYGKPFSLDLIKTSKNIIDKKITKGHVNVMQLGEQEIEISITNKDQKTITDKVLLTIVDTTKPEIKVNKELTTEAGKPFDIKRFITSKDSTDKDMNDKLIITPYQTDKVRTQNVTISVVDSSNNKTEVTIKLNVVDTTNPVINIKEKNIIFKQGETINFDLKSNVTATDNADGDITNKVIINGDINSIDINKTGKYPITYKVKDSSNNENSVTIYINIINEKYAPMKIYFNGKEVTYLNGGLENGQKIIDNDESVASTWGGVEEFSGIDNKNTQFIGHDLGSFKDIWKVSQFVVTDKDGVDFTYKVDKVYQVDDYAVGVKDKIDYWNRITGTEGGERIVLQTCHTETINWIIEASIVR